MKTDSVIHEFSSKSVICFAAKISSKDLPSDFRLSTRLAA